MPAEPGSSVPPAIDSLERVVALVRAQLDELQDRRRHDRALTDGWLGGHRERFETRVLEIEARARRVADRLALIALAQRRALDEPSAP